MAGQRLAARLRSGSDVTNPAALPACRVCRHLCQALSIRCVGGTLRAEVGGRQSPELQASEPWGNSSERTHDSESCLQCPTLDFPEETCSPMCKPRSLSDACGAALGSSCKRSQTGFLPLPFRRRVVWEIPPPARRAWWCFADCCLPPL